MNDLNNPAETNDDLFRLERRFEEFKLDTEFRLREVWREIYRATTSE